MIILNHLNNIKLKKNISLNLNYNFYYGFNNFNLYRSIFNECKKHLLNKEIKFDNISTKKKKQDNENIISTNFTINNFLNILNTNIKNNFYVQKNSHIKKQKKKLDENIKLKFYTSFKNKEKINIEKNDKKNKILKNNKTLKNLIFIRNKYFLFDNYSIINSSKKPCNKNTFNKTSSNLNVIKNKQNSIKDSKNFIYFKNDIKNISDIYLSKNTHKNQNFTNEINSFKKIDENNLFKSNKKSLLVLNFKDNIQWKKAISQQVLLCISNKENKAEIRLKPESLGSIYIKIKIKDNQAKLKFISDHIEIKNFLNNCMPFLKDSLIKHGIFLKKFNILSYLHSDENKNLFISKYNPKTSNAIKKFYKNSIQTKVVDMYI